MCIEIPPQHAVAAIIGFLQGKSAVAIALQCGGKRQILGGQGVLFETLMWSLASEGKLMGKS